LTTPVAGGTLRRVVGIGEFVPLVGAVAGAAALVGVFLLGLLAHSTRRELQRVREAIAHRERAEFASSLVEPNGSRPSRTSSRRAPSDTVEEALWFR
jgi:hypothetical protein